MTSNVPQLVLAAVNAFVVNHLNEYERATVAFRTQQPGRPVRGFDRLTMEFPFRREGLDGTIPALKDLLADAFADEATQHFQGSIPKMLEAASQLGGFAIEAYPHVIGKGERAGQTMTCHYVRTVSRPLARSYGDEKISTRFQFRSAAKPAASVPTPENANSDTTAK